MSYYIIQIRNLHIRSEGSRSCSGNRSYRSCRSYRSSVRSVKNRIVCSIPFVEVSYRTRFSFDSHHGSGSYTNHNSNHAEQKNTHTKHEHTRRENNLTNVYSLPELRCVACKQTWQPPPRKYPPAASVKPVVC